MKPFPQVNPLSQNHHGKGGPVSCCDHNAPPTGCNQGRDCPVRRHRITSEQSAEAARLMDVTRITEARRVPRPPVADVAIPTEAGNVWFSGKEPAGIFDDLEEFPPLTRKEVLIISSITACVLVPWLVVIAVGVRYVLERAAA